MVLRQSFHLLAAGLVIGLVGALFSARLFHTLLFGIGARDPLTFTAVALLLGAVATVACLVPARRAANVDPITALRDS